MNREEFELLAAKEFKNVPTKFANRLKNVALLVEEDGELLGLYTGIPATERGEGYGNLGTMPDTITLFYRPLLEEAEVLLGQGRATDLEGAVVLAIRETLWHEIGHHFGMDEIHVEEREDEGTNRFES